MSQYHANLYIETAQLPKHIVSVMIQRCPFLALSKYQLEGSISTGRADESFWLSVDDLTIPKRANSRYLWEKHGVRANVRVTFSLNRGEATKPTRDIGRQSFIHCMNEAINLLQGDFFVKVMDSRPGGIVMWRHGDQVDIDLHRSEWWQPEHLRMFSFPYTLKDLPEN